MNYNVNMHEVQRWAWRRPRLWRGLAGRLIISNADHLGKTELRGAPLCHQVSVPHRQRALRLRAELGGRRAVHSTGGMAPPWPAPEISSGESIVGPSPAACGSVTPSLAQRLLGPEAETSSTTAWKSQTADSLGCELLPAVLHCYLRGATGGCVNFARIGRSEFLATLERLGDGDAVSFALAALMKVPKEHSHMTQLSW